MGAARAGYSDNGRSGRGGDVWVGDPTPHAPGAPGAPDSRAAGAPALCRLTPQDAGAALMPTAPLSTSARPKTAFLSMVLISGCMHVPIAQQLLGYTEHLHPWLQVFDLREKLFQKYCETSFQKPSLL